MSAAYLSTGDNTILIFGASGDLTARKLIPALFQLSQKGFLNSRSPIIGVARRDKTDEDFRNELRESVLKGEVDEQTATAWDTFAKQLFYRKVDISVEADYVALHESAKQLEQQLGTKPDSPRVVYLATAPSLFDDAVRGLNSAGMIPEDRKHRDRLRVVVEKPFGHDLQSAEVLNEQLRNYLHEDQIYRMDHYLGKETVQNLMAVRFGNVLFEPLWNNHYVDHIQITVAETVSVGGRGAYYDRAGAMRDMVQNHLMQLLCLIAMEPPSQFGADAVRDEKLKVIRALEPVEGHHVVRGQYDADGETPGSRRPHRRRRGAGGLNPPRYGEGDRRRRWRG